MSETRSLTKHFRIKSPIMGVPRSAYQSGIFPTKDKALIAMLRRLPSNRAEEIPDTRTVDASIGSDELDGLTWHEIQKLGSEKGVLKSGMDRPAIEQAIRELVSAGVQIA